ncbi:extracellular solute-binding protein [Butyrivibrio sp. WCE2006]|uniref:extracellular solute-binding protein n=1 Tax=Butyrivibrio sp. WCE2006 TaxID=1410611 RepID=UPI0005D2936A|nr:extracellular solute-binding protein [Butyrivibrio sp. WCE2006]
MGYKKLVSVMATMAMTASVLTACGGSSSAPEGAATNDPAAEKTETTQISDSETAKSASGKEEVVIWDYFETDAQKEMMDTLLTGFNSSQDKYEATHTYVPFADYEKQLTLGIASGELPDVVILDGCDMASFISMDLFGDISDADIDWSEYIEGPMNSTMMDGKHYGLPFATNCTALFYNKDILDAAGVAYPDENTTWEEFHEMAKKLTDYGVTGFGNAAIGTDEGTFQCLQWLYTAGGSYTDIENGKDAYVLMQDMIKDGSWSKECVNWAQSDVCYNWEAGNIAMMQNGPWQVPGIAKDAPDINYGVTVLPKKDASAGQATSILGGENMGAVKKDNMEGAKAFLEYYNKTEVMVQAMKQYGSFPPKTEAAKDTYWTNDPIMSEFITQLSTSIPRGPSAIWPSYSNAIQTGFQEVLTLSKDPDKAAKDTQAAVDAVK